MTSTPPIVYDDSESVNAHERVRQPVIITGSVILVIGTIGNILAFIILRRKALRVYTTAFLLSLLAICDMACLYLGLLSKIFSYYYRGQDVFRTVVPYSCQIHVFLLYSALHYTSWLLAIVSVERFISTWFPHRSLSLCSIRNAKIAALVLLAIVIGYQSHFFYTMELQLSDASSQLFHDSNNNNNGDNNNNNNLDVNSPLLKPTLDPSSQKEDDISPTPYLSLSSLSSVGAEEEPMPPPYECKEVSEFDYFHKTIWPMIDLVMFCFGPFGVMLVTNTMIAWRILEMRREGELVVASASPARRLSGMTMIMFSCTLTFFALTFPISVYIVVRRQNEQIMSNPAIAIVWPAVLLLQYVNNAINFFLYCLTGSMFRRELRRFVQEWLVKVQSLISVLSATISEEKADRAAAANSNGHLVLIEIGENNNNRGIIGRFLNRSQNGANRGTRTTALPPSGDPYAVTASMPVGVIYHRRNSDSGGTANNNNHNNNGNLHHQGKTGADEPLLNHNNLHQQNRQPVGSDYEMAQVPQIYVGAKNDRKKRKKMPKVRAIGSKFAERFRFRLDDSEATSGCYNSGLEFAQVPNGYIVGDYNYNEKALATITDMQPGTPQQQKENNNKPEAKNDNNNENNENNSSAGQVVQHSASCRLPKEFVTSYRYQRRMTAEEKALLEEFGPHC